MKTLAVAVTGSHGTGKSFIINDLLYRASVSNIPTYTIISPTRYIKSLGFENNQNLDYKMEVMCLAERIKRQKEALRDALQAGVDKTLIISDRCCLDELSYTREAIEREDVDVASVLQGYNRAFKLKQCYSLFYDWVVEDLFNFWDCVFYKPIHPDYPPIADGDRLGDVQYQRSIDEHMSFHFNDMEMKENYVRDRFRRLDPDRVTAADEMWKYITEKLEI